MGGTEGSQHLERNGVFAVNILMREQEPISRYFSSKDRPRGRDAFRDIPHRTSITGSPIIEGAAAFLDCRLHDAHTAGDHEIFIGEVLALNLTRDLDPLLFFAGQYRLMGPG
jgi:flavin reductase (DIM6/NTAB) family NADH-FMN oxidoreductase RutF